MRSLSIAPWYGVSCRSKFTEYGAVQPECGDTMQVQRLYSRLRVVQSRHTKEVGWRRGEGDAVYEAPVQRVSVAPSASPRKLGVQPVGSLGFPQWQRRPLPLVSHVRGVDVTEHCNAERACNLGDDYMQLGRVDVSVITPDDRVVSGVAQGEP